MKQDEEDFSFRKLKLSYRRTVRDLKRKLKQLKPGDGDIDMIEEMISDCNYVIEWLHTGRRPGNRRGIERRAAYQREKLMDPVRMQAYVQRSTAGSPSNLSEYQRYQIKDALSVLSPRERECYVLAHGECFSHSAIASMLNISKDSVTEYISRAQKKISHELESSLFLIQ
ncbi:RNA polymerase subunit sigma-24 [Paenibacillus sp. P96]|uniref:RNA polymerase subunit sigma-24 n=1 Tax=Paenibacillus zeirhizosphaerae TaxID=2987519 RepID=A0ABT9FL65_9BACL|nr:sigma factor-like helix-turn-helix DNA-binding protein [Paenibacillus sp. P96]MDP4095458.1 RNA polymerase subunit sigma-24 [Paenibacillus sp. P96]